MICFKCGKELHNDDKWCFSCGALNIYHPDNKSTLDFYNQNKIEDTTQNSNDNVNIGISNPSTLPNNDINSSLSNVNSLQSNINNNLNQNIYLNTSDANENNEINNTSFFAGISIPFLIVNGIFIILILIATFFSKESSGWITSILSIIYFLSFQLLFIKASLPWWGFFIPIYNICLINKIAFGSSYPLLIIVIPYSLLILPIIFKSIILGTILVTIIRIISIIYYFVLVFCLGKSFGRSGLLTILIPFIIIPSTAFSPRFQYIY